MLSVGLTGGIGSGKSMFAALLADLGAEIVDADKIGHAVLEPGEPAWRAVVDQFGHEILVPGTMEIARKQLAEIVFNDPSKLAVLNAITHPRILERIAETFEMLGDTGEIVVLDSALIVGTGFEHMVEVIVVVDASDAVRKERLIRDRGMLPRDVDARVGSQIPRDVLLERADIVVVNDGDPERLKDEARRVWDELVQRSST